MNPIDNVIKRYAEKHTEIKEALAESAPRKATPINESEFWQIVATTNWKEVLNSKHVKKILKAGLTPIEAEEFYNHFYDFKERLAKLVSASQYSSEAFDKLSSQEKNILYANIIGSGKQNYLDILKNSNLLEKQASMQNFEDCFAYSIPDENDYL